MLKHAKGWKLGLAAVQIMKFNWHSKVLWEILSTSLQFPVDQVGSQIFKKHVLVSICLTPVHREASTSLFPGCWIHENWRDIIPTEQVFEHALHGFGVHLYLKRRSDDRVSWLLTFSFSSQLLETVTLPKSLHFWTLTEMYTSIHLGPAYLRVKTCRIRLSFWCIQTTVNPCIPVYKLLKILEMWHLYIHLLYYTYASAPEFSMTCLVI